MSPVVLPLSRAAAFAGRVRDVSEFLAEVGPAAPRHPLPVSIAYHDACHLSHGQRIRSQPRELLRGIPGLEVREVREGSLCCGSAGVWNLLNPEPAREIGEWVHSVAGDALDGPLVLLQGSHLQP